MGPSWSYRRKQDAILSSYSSPQSVQSVPMSSEAWGDSETSMLLANLCCRRLTRRLLTNGAGSSDVVWIFLPFSHSQQIWKAIDVLLFKPFVMHCWSSNMQHAFGTFAGKLQLPSKFVAELLAIRIPASFAFPTVKSSATELGGRVGSLHPTPLVNPKWLRQTITEMLFGVLSALIHLHCLQIVHRDVKGENEPRPMMNQG